MKRILFLLLITGSAFGQPVSNTGEKASLRTTGTVTVIDPHLIVTNSLTIPRWPDTLTANAAYAKGADSSGRIIYVYATKSLHIRIHSPKMWVNLAQGWSLTGNAGTSPLTNFIGTTDNQSLSFRVNNTQFMRLHNTGNNISIGEGAMLPTQTGINGVAIGYQALNANTSGNGNIAIGYQALLQNNVRKGHVAIGWQAGQLNTVGEHHTYIGTHSGQFVNAGNENVGIGSYSLEYSNNTEAGENTAVGTYSRFFGGNRTTAVGYRSGWTASFPGPSTKPSLYSTSIGYHSLYTIENDTSVTALGDFTLGANGIKNATAIGSRAYVGQNNSLVLGSISGINGATANTKVGIGTHLPDSTLHVVGGLKFVTGRQGAGKVLTSNASGGADWETASFYWADRGSNNISNTNSGNVGIGNTTPLFKLDVSGNANIEGSVDAGPALTVTNNSTSSSSGLVVNCASSGSTSLASFVSNGSDRFTIRNTGEILINSSAGSSGQVLQSNGFGVPPSWVTPSSSSGTVTSVATNTGSGITGGTITTTGTLAIDTVNIATRARVQKGIDSLGAVISAVPNYWSVTGSNISNNTGTNVGIGTTTPISKLQVNGSVRLSDTLLFNDAGYGPTYLPMLYKVDGPTIRLNGVYTEVSSNHPGGNVRFFTNGGFGIMTAGGQFSLGSYVPTAGAMLHVEGAAQVTTNLGIGSSTAPSTYLDITGDKFRLRSSKTPSSATDTGNAGDICWDANYIYICTATNTWKRSAIATW